MQNTSETLIDEISRVINAHIDSDGRIDLYGAAETLAKKFSPSEISVKSDAALMIAFIRFMQANTYVAEHKGEMVVEVDLTAEDMLKFVQENFGSPKRESEQVLCPVCGMDIKLYNHPQPCNQKQESGEQFSFEICKFCRGEGYVWVLSGNNPSCIPCKGTGKIKRIEDKPQREIRENKIKGDRDATQDGYQVEGVFGSVSIKDAANKIFEEDKIHYPQSITEEDAIRFARICAKVWGVKYYD
jgi:hypothetical protein